MQGVGYSLLPTSHWLILPGLRYLEFHHVDTVPLPVNTNHRLADGRIGLREVKDMSELVDALRGISMKEWFRQNMGMSKPP
jgi:hypothetical protein